MDESREEALTDLATRPDTEPDVDQDLLAEAQRHLAGAWPNAAINEALQYYVEAQRAKRREALERLRQLNDEGAFDYSRLEEADK